MLQEGIDVNSCDYDQRTALMVAAGRGHSAMVRQLLLAGAIPNLKDELGSCALLEAAKGGHELTIR
jgi:ankyrin repeat protein